MGIPQFIAGFIVSLILAIYFGFFADDRYYPLVAYPIGFMIIFAILTFTSIS